MPTFIEAIAALEGKFIEVGTQGEWTDKGQLRSVEQDHLVMQQANSERLVLVKIAAIEYIKEVPMPGAARSAGRIAK